MNGRQLKQKLEETNLSMRSIADKLGGSPQSLSQMFKADDVRTGFLEKVCMTLDLPMSHFYEGVHLAVKENTGSFNTNDSRTLDDLTNIINEQRKRIDYLTDQLLTHQ